MSFKLVAGNASREFKQYDSVDSSVLYGNVLEATASLDNASKNLEIAERLMSSITVAINSAEQVKAISDDEPAMVVAMASTRVSLSQAGISDNEIDRLVVGDDYEAVVANASNIVSSAWETAKEYAKKVWEYIRNLINSIVDYVMDLFGKGGDSGEVLIELLKKLKKDGKTKLEETEFSEGVQERIAKQIPFIAANTSSELSIDDYVGFVNTSASIVDSIKLESEDGVQRLANLNHGVALWSTIKVGKDTYFVGYTIATGEITIKDKKLTILEYSDAPKEVQEVYDGYMSTKEESKGLVDTLKNIYTTVYSNELDFSKIAKDLNIEESDITKELDDDATYGIVNLVGYNGKKASIMVVYGTDDGKDEFEAYVKGETLDGIKHDSEEIGDKAVLQLRTILKSIKAKEVVVSVNVDEAIRNKENIKPLDYVDAMKVAKVLKDSSKDLDKKLSNFKKESSKLIKEQTKKLEQQEKELQKNENPNVDSRIDLEINTNVNRLLQDIIKIRTKGIGITATELSNSSLTVLIKESARLYVK